MTIKHTLGTLCAAILVASSVAGWAGEGHDHGEAPAAQAGKSLPVVTAVSESFELVGRLHHDELSILIDRADTTEPVLNASLTIDVDGRSVVAPFHADHGDYSMSDPAALAKLHQVGSKPLTFTLVAGNDSDLLTGELDVHDEESTVAAQLNGWKEYALWTGVALAGLALLTLLVRRTRASRNPHLGGVA